MFFASLVLALAAAQPGLGAPATDALIAEAGAALDGGKADYAQRLADDALKEPGVTALQRGRLLLDRGLAHELQGHHAEAMIDFTSAIETHALSVEERAQALLQRGFLLDAQGRLDDAAKDYSAAVGLRTPAMATALNNRANVYRRLNRLQEARRDYLAALGAGTGRSQYPYYGLGQIAEAQQDKEAARGFYAKAGAAEPGYQLAVERLAELGGPPETTLAQPDVIKLRPPAKPAASIATRLQSAKAASPRRKPAPAAGPGLRPALDGPSLAVGPEVQLGAWRSEPEAQAGWDKARLRAGTALDGHVAHIVRATIPGRGAYFRLRVPATDPSGLCVRLRSIGLDCVPARD
jgi:tetratricopeptide (TPR) repeat protein